MRITRKEAIEVKKLVDRFNRKVSRSTRAGKKGQPKKISYKDFLRDAQAMGRQNFNFHKKSLQNYLKKGAELPYTTKEGVNITIWEKKEIDRLHRSINAKKREVIKRKNTKDFQLINKREREALNLEPRKNNIERVKPKNYEKYKENLQKAYYHASPEYKFNLLKSNMLKAARANFGQGSDIEKIIKTLSEEELIRAINSVYTSLNFFYLNDVESGERQRLVKEELLRLKEELT